MFCLAFFAASFLGISGKKTTYAVSVSQEDTPNIYAVYSGTNWSSEEGLLTLSGVNWYGTLTFEMETEIALENSSTNTIVGDQGTALVLTGDVTISGAGKLILGTNDTAVEQLIDFENGENVNFVGTCLAYVGDSEEPIELLSPLTQETTAGVNYIEITTESYVESSEPEGGEPEGGDPVGGEPEGGEPEGGDPGVENPSIEPIAETVKVGYDELVNGKYVVSTMFNFSNCDDLTKAYYLVSEDGQTETPFPADTDEYEISTTGTYKFKVKVLNDGGTSLAECTATLVVEKFDIDVSLAFGKWEYGENPTPQLTGEIPEGASVTYRYYLDAGHTEEVATNGGIPTEIGIYYAVVTIGETSTTNASTAEASFEIVAKTISINWSADNYTYNGQVQTVAASYVAGGQTIDLKVTIDKEFKNAQSYTATASFKNGETNYVLPDNPTNTYTINKRSVTIQIDNKKSTYLEDLRTLTARPVIGSLVSGEVPYTLSSLARKDVMGEYDIIGETTDENYNISFNKGKYSVVNKITSLSLGDWTYGETPKTPEVTAYYGEDQVIYTYTSTNGYNSTTAPTDPGKYIVKAEISLPEEYYNDYKTASFTIHHLVVEDPVGDKTTYTYDGQYKIYNLVGQDEYYTITGAVQSEAGTHKVIVTLNDSVHYKWRSTNEATLEYAFVINKLKIEKPAKDTRVFKYSGFNLTYSIAENSAYSVTGNVQSEMGTHIVTIELSDKKNTCWVDGSSRDLQYEFVIRGSNINDPITTNPDGEVLSNNPVTIISSDGNGIDPDVELNVVVGDVKDENQLNQIRDQLKEHIEKYDAIHTIYDVTLQKDNVEIQPNGAITLKIAVPEELRSHNFKLYHIHVDESGNVSVEDIACSVSNQGFVTIQVDKLSEFVFVYKQNSLKALIITFVCLVIVLAAALALQIWMYLKNNKKGGKKLSSTSLALAPAMFVGGEIVWSIILGVLVLGLLAGNVVMLLLLIKLKKGSKKPAETDANENKQTTQAAIEVEEQQTINKTKKKEKTSRTKVKEPKNDEKLKSSTPKKKTSKEKTKSAPTSADKKEKLEMRSLDFTKKK